MNKILSGACARDYTLGVNTFFEHGFFLLIGLPRFEVMITDINPDAAICVSGGPFLKCAFRKLFLECKLPFQYVIRRIFESFASQAGQSDVLVHEYVPSALPYESF